MNDPTKILVYSLSDLAQKPRGRDILKSIGELADATQLSLRITADSLRGDFYALIDSMKPDLLVLLNPVLPDPRNQADHVAVFRGWQPRTHDLVSLTDLQDKCNEKTRVVGFEVAAESSSIFETVFGPHDSGAFAFPPKSEVTLLGSEDHQRFDSVMSLVVDAKANNSAQTRINNIWLTATNGHEVLWEGDHAAERPDPDPGQELPNGKEPKGKHDDNWVWREQGEWKSVKSRPLPSSSIAEHMGSFSVVSWVRVGNRSRQVWVDTRSWGKPRGAWPSGKGWVMGTLQYKTPRPALLFQLNTGGTSGSHGWTGQNFVARGEQVINDGLWHSLAVVVTVEEGSVEEGSVEEGSVQNVKLWVDGELDGEYASGDPNLPSVNLTNVSYFPANAEMLLGESRDAYIKDSKTATDFHGDLAGVGVYQRALSGKEVARIADELKQWSRQRD